MKDPNIVQYIEYNKTQQQRYFNKTGIFVNIQNIGKNKELLAVRERFSITEIHNGVWLRKKAINYPDGSFTNVYDLSWSQNIARVTPKIVSSNEPYHLYDQINKKRSTIAVLNGAFFFLADIADKRPKDICNNLCIRNKQIIGLPSWDQPIAYIKKGKFNTFEPKAIGTIKISGQELTWIGANSTLDKNQDAVLYNSKCADVIKYRHPKTNVNIAELDNSNVHTAKNKDVVDLVVNLKDGKLIINKINKGGRTHYFDGLFILQISKKQNKFKVGDLVSPLTLDGLNLKEMESAITINRSVHDPFFKDPVRKDRRDARTVIAEDFKGNIHFVVFDGSKYIPGFDGVSAEMVTSYFSPAKYKWAYFLDGGGSSRLITKRENEINLCANEFVFRKINSSSNPNEVDPEKFFLLWDWEKGRLVASSIALELDRS